VLDDIAVNIISRKAGFALVMRRGWLHVKLLVGNQRKITTEHKFRQKFHDSN
jgi:hypothetical protein